MRQGLAESAAGNAAVDRFDAIGASVIKPDCVKSRNIDGTLQDYIEYCWEDDMTKNDITRAKIIWVKHRHNKLIGTLSSKI